MPASKFLSCSGKAKISGSFSLDLSKVNVSFTGGTTEKTQTKGKSFTASLSWDTTVTAKLDADARTTCTPNSALKKLGPTWIIAGVTVTIHPDFKLGIDASGEVTATQTTTEVLTAKGKFGLHVPTVSHTTTANKPTVTASGTATLDALIGANARLSVGILSIDFDIMGGIHAEATAKSSPAEVCVSGYPEVYLTGTASIHAWKWNPTLQFLNLDPNPKPIYVIDGHSVRFSGCALSKPVITSTHLSDAIVGQPYSAELTTADHRAGTWSITTGALPVGLTLNGNTIGGTPTTPGDNQFGLKFIDAHGNIATAAAEILVTQLTGPPILDKFTASVTYDNSNQTLVINYDWYISGNNTMPNAFSYPNGAGTVGFQCPGEPIDSGGLAPFEQDFVGVNNGVAHFDEQIVAYGGASWMVGIQCQINSPLTIVSADGSSASYATSQLNAMGSTTNFTIQ